MRYDGRRQGSSAVSAVSLASGSPDSRRNEPRPQVQAPTVEAQRMSRPEVHRIWIGSGVVAFVLFLLITYALAPHLLGGPPRGFTGFRIFASGCWRGHLGNNESSSSVDGCESRDIPWACVGVLSGDVSKEEYESWTLTLQVVVGGGIVESDSTSERAYAAVSVRASC